MPETIPHATLKEKQRALRAGFPETMGLHVHRTISWIGRAEQAGDDFDAAFFVMSINVLTASSLKPRLPVLS